MCPNLYNTLTHSLAFSKNQDSVNWEKEERLEKKYGLCKPETDLNFKTFSEAYENNKYSEGHFTQILVFDIPFLRCGRHHYDHDIHSETLTSTIYSGNVRIVHFSVKYL